MQRTVSDHCVVILKEKETDVDWGPKPFRMMNCWREVVGYEEFVKAQYCVGMNIEGWKGYVLKGKIKGVKNIVKEWNKAHFGNLDEQIQQTKNKLQEHDLKGEDADLSVEEVIQRRVFCKVI